MTAVPWRRITGGIIGSRAPMADVGELRSSVVSMHPYLDCACGAELWEGVNEEGAVFYACTRCKCLVDVRRVS